MLELGAGADILRALGWLNLGLMVLLIAVALWMPKRWWQKAMGVIAVLLVFVGPAYMRSRERAQLVDEHKARYEAAKAVFDERCKTAGEKIYRTVDDVEGVLLLNVPPSASDTDLHSQNWPDAGLPRQHGASSYIGYFLFSIKPTNVLTGKPEPGDRPGYRFVDAKDGEGVLWRYTLKEKGGQGIDEIGFPGLIKTKNKGLLARYAVSYTNLIAPQDREHWVAGTTVKISDTQTGETLAQSTWYSLERGFGSRAGHRMPWRFAVSCPELRAHQAMAPVRFFVDHVLKPKQGR